MEKIATGFTNNSYRDGNVFYQEKTKNRFNHNLDYSLLEKFDFVPKLIENTDQYSKWEFIEGSEVTTQDSDLKEIAQIIHQIHNSKLDFPPHNIGARVREYQKQLRAKGVKIPVIDDFYRRVNLIISKSRKSVPCHNDLWLFNMKKDENGKIFLFDWEYATLGDPHFDLAYFICASNLTPEQEKVFLDSYPGTWWEDYLINQKILVNYLVVLWVNVQPEKYFDDSKYINEIYNLAKLYDEKKKNKEF
ncbi:hypothetical protein C4M96_03335 [Mycoplasmopsis pullorum]|uniref:phosphotransferase n=1 Tax=Mycoplasmopsis pullorum TaxID=48003 RepID=UPI001117D9FE|nr:phosphotransferase [Mycoplasmopsis pullorum]TNK83070.1 hypothetical protein C4M93_02985 [Mycoplasmopsis pullorum]TNK91809.1 hypothetical protein C4M96_03335 [Mycoplasmopsis pullorum]